MNFLVSLIMAENAYQQDQATNRGRGYRDDGAGNSNKETTTVMQATYTRVLPADRKPA